MPKLRTPEKPFAKLARTIRYYASTREVSAALGKCDQTSRLRMKSPEDFTLRELRQISRARGIPWGEIIEAIK